MWILIPISLLVLFLIMALRHDGARPPSPVAATDGDERLAGARQIYGVNALMDETAARHLGDGGVLREIDLLLPKGGGEPMRLYELMSPVGAATDVQLALREHYEAGLEAYRERRWKDAMGELWACLEIVPDDGPSRALLARTQRLSGEDPGPEWDGVWRQT